MTLLSRRIDAKISPIRREPHGIEQAVREESQGPKAADKVETLFNVGI